MNLRCRFPPVLAGIVIGISMLLAFVTAGRGIGISGFMMRLVATVQHWILPAGEYEFTVSAPGVVDAHLSTPLFSTVRDFPDRDSARRVARQVLERLFQGGAETDSVDPVVAQLERSGFKRPVSRRALLRDWLSAGQEPDHA